MMQILSIAGICDPATYRIGASSKDDVRWAASLATKVYQGIDVIPESTMLNWFRANPNGFSTFWHGDERAGNFTLLPLRETAMQRFVIGELLERDLYPEDMIGPAEAHTIRNLHWESIVLDPDFHGPRPQMMKMFVLSFPALVARLCPPAQVEGITAIAASKEGAGVLRRMGLSSAEDAASRLDGHPLYRGTMQSYREIAGRLFRRGSHAESN